jgi:hypothetical protein
MSCDAHIGNDKVQGKWLQFYDQGFKVDLDNG